MPAAIWTPKAESDFEEILYYIRISDQRPITAQRIGEQIQSAANEQANRPTAGAHHPAIPENWLYTMHKRWLILYKPTSNGIEVMRIIDGSRDLPRALSF